MRKVRIGFVGVGRMGQCAHLRNYVLLPDCQVVAIAEIREKLGQAVANRYGIQRVYRDHRQMLARENLDAIVASQPFIRHGQLIPELLSARIPIFIEKPLACSLEVGQALLVAVRQSGSWLMVGYHKRSDPAVEAAKAEIDRLKKTGQAGKMQYVRLTMPPGDWIAGGFEGLIETDEVGSDLPTDRRPGDLDESAWKEYLSLVNYYIHQINLLRFLLGEPYSVSYAHPSGKLLVGTSVSGIPGIIEMAPYTTARTWQESGLIGFERGYLKIELPPPLAVNQAGRLEIFLDIPGRKTQLVKPEMPPVQAMRRQAENFVRAVKGEGEIPCGVEEAFQDLIVARDYLRLLRGV
ncbi:MAG: Gfo/Idh/MocA family oxidoreductase [Candidatus Omnitrophica bacterium]|nr:Gfo/Idh/MocA family oxidoreductase [Candidatus Omnitrophota bacterium]